MLGIVAVKKGDNCSIVCRGDYDLVAEAYDTFKEIYGDNIVLSEIEEEELDRMLRSPYYMYNQLKDKFENFEEHEESRFEDMSGFTESFDEPEDTEEEEKVDYSGFTLEMEDNLYS